MLRHDSRSTSATSAATLPSPIPGGANVESGVDTTGAFWTIQIGANALRQGWGEGGGWLCALEYH